MSTCLKCGKELTRNTCRNGNPEHYRDFIDRKYCNSDCSKIGNSYGRKPLLTRPDCCLTCKENLIMNIYSNGDRESTQSFMKRKYCSRICLDNRTDKKTGKRSPRVKSFTLGHIQDAFMAQSDYFGDNPNAMCTLKDLIQGLTKKSA